jgi:hypothetical protein
MRRSSFSAFSFSLLLASTVGATACDWREFDDIADTTWVKSSGAPSGVDSDDFAVALAEANNEATNETKQLAVISRSGLNLSFLAFDNDGEVTVRQSISLDTNANGAFDVLPQSPIYASDPRSGRVAVTANGKVVIGEATRNTLEVASPPNSASSAGLTFFRSGTTNYLAAATEKGISLIDLATPTVTTPICTTTPGDLFFRIIALGTATVGGAEQLVVWYEAASVSYVNTFTVTVAGGTCSLTAVGTAVSGVLSAASRSDYPLIEGARILPVPGTELAAIADPGKSQVFLLAPTGNRLQLQFDAPSVSSLAIGQLGADTFLFAGAASFDNEGKNNTGRVQATKLVSGAPSATPELTLFDAAPEAEQKFGRAIAVVPFDDAASPIVVVGADDEMFTYFRTSLYEERRDL